MLPHFGRPELGAFREPVRMTPKTPTITAAVLSMAALGACSTPRQSVQSSKPPNPVVMKGDSAAIANAKPDKTRYAGHRGGRQLHVGNDHHHAQAIVMAKMAPTHGASSSILTLAGRIINAQTDEIELMSQWLRDHRQPVPEPNAQGHEDEDGRRRARHAHARHAHRGADEAARRRARAPTSTSCSSPS